jgi:hypothetical protein
MQRLRGLRARFGVADAKVFENKLELITFMPDGHLLHTHKTTFVQRRSLDTWPDLESAKKAAETELGHVRWGDPEE